ncbi:MAG: glycosyltransferase family A protein [Bacteroidota bacterium]
MSVLIRTKNSEDTLSTCLDYLNAQDFSFQEIVVVDSGSTDRTLKIAKEYDCHIIHYPEDQEFNYSKAINIGVEQMNSDYILILSSHAYLTNDTAISWMHYFLSKHPEAGGLSINKYSHSIRLVKELEKIKWCIVNKQNFEGYALSNVCSLIKRGFWKKYPFNEDISRCEDIDWSFHFFQTTNQYILRLENIFVLYQNPYYTPKKDIVDHLLIGRHFYPRWRSLHYIKDQYLQAIFSFVKGKWRIAYQKFRLASAILKDRVREESIQSGHLVEKTSN